MTNLSTDFHSCSYYMWWVRIKDVISQNVPWFESSLHAETLLLVYWNRPNIHFDTEKYFYEGWDLGVEWTEATLAPGFLPLQELTFLICNLKSGWDCEGKIGKTMHTSWLCLIRGSLRWGCQPPVSGLHVSISSGHDTAPSDHSLQTSSYPPSRMSYRVLGPLSHPPPRVWNKKSKCTGIIH